MESGTAPLPGLEEPINEDIRDAALVVNTRADVTAAKGREKKDVEKLVTVMQEHGVRSYFDQERNLTVKIEETEHVVVLLGEKKIGKKNPSPVTSPGPGDPEK